MSRWRSAGVAGLSSVPARPGVYVAFKHGELMYIGQSLNVRARLLQHASGASEMKYECTPLGYVGAAGLIFKYKVYRESSGEWLATEYRLIRRLKPPLNATLGLSSSRRKARIDQINKALVKRAVHSKPLRPSENRSERMKFLDGVIQSGEFIPQQRLKSASLTVGEQREVFENWVNYRNLRA